MATKSNSMFKISQLAKDLGVKPKELQGTLEELGVSGKSTSATLEGDEINLFFEAMTQKAKIKDIDGYVNGKTSIPAVKPSKAAIAAKERKAAEAKKKAELKKNDAAGADKNPCLPRFFY